MSCLWRCPQFRGVLIEGFHCIHDCPNIDLSVAVFECRVQQFGVESVVVSVRDGVS